jgi:hypothetical protein
MKLKRILCVAFVVILAVSSLAGCGGEKKEAPATGHLTLWMGNQNPGGLDNFGDAEGIKKVQENLDLVHMQQQLCLLVYVLHLSVLMLENVSQVVEVISCL